MPSGPHGDRVHVIGAGPGGLAAAAALRRRGCRPSCWRGPTPSAPPGAGTTTGSTCTPRAARRACRASRSRDRFGRWVARDDVVRLPGACTPCTTGSTCAPASRSNGSHARGTTAGWSDDRRRASRSPASDGRRRHRLQPHARAAATGPGVETFTGELAARLAPTGTPTPYARQGRARRRRRQHRRRDRRRPGRGRRGARAARRAHRRRTSSGARTSAGRRRAPASWCATCPSRVVDRIAAARRARRGARPVGARAAAARHRPVLPRASRARSRAGRRPDRGRAGAHGRAGRGRGVVRRRGGRAGRRHADHPGRRRRGHRVPPRARARWSAPRRAGRARPAARARTADGSRTAPGLYFTGYTNPISGMFRELRIDAERIARAVAAERQPA